MSSTCLCHFHWFNRLKHRFIHINKNVCIAFATGQEKRASLIKIALVMPDVRFGCAPLRLF
jgi:hypothetical protein